MTYLQMWERVKTLSAIEKANKLEDLRPPTGKEVDFLGIKVIDIDLVEALEYYPHRSQK